MVVKYLSRRERPSVSQAWRALGQIWDNDGTNLLSIGMNDDSKQKAQVIDSHGLFLWFPGRGERIRTSGLYVPNVALYQAKLHPDGVLLLCFKFGEPTAEPLIVANLRSTYCLECKPAR